MTTPLTPDTVAASDDGGEADGVVASWATIGCRLKDVVTVICVRVLTTLIPDGAVVGPALPLIPPVILAASRRSWAA